MFGPLGMPELVVIFVIALIVFGPRKLPELGKSLGKSLAEFKRASNELRNSLEDEIRIEEDRERAAKAAPATPAPAVTTEPEASSDAEEVAPQASEVAPQPADETTPRGAAV
jgi:sec-independent protein translocase protein TatA